MTAPRRRRPAALAAGLLAGCLAAPHAAWATGPPVAGEAAPADGAPLRLPDRFLLAVPFLALEPAGATVLPPGRWRLASGFTVANQWAHERALEPYLNGRSARGAITLAELRALAPRQGDGIFYVDGELHEAWLEVRRGLGHGLEIGFFLPWRDGAAGFADPFVEPFHDALSFDEAGRRGVPRDRYTVYLRSGGAPGEPLEIFASEPPPPGWGDIAVAIKARLPASSGWRLAVEAMVELPAGDEERFFGSGSWDAGVQVATSRRLGPGRLDASAGAARLGAYGRLRAPAQWTWMAAAGFEWPVGGRWRGLARTTLAASPLRHLGLPELGRPAWLVDLGARCGVGGGREIFVAVTENVFTYQSSADIAFHLGGAAAWGGED